MKTNLYKLACLLLLPVLIVLGGCEDSLTDSNTAGTPDVVGGDSTSTAFLTIVSGSESNPNVGTINRRGIFGPDSVLIEVEPNFGVRSDIEFEYSLSGSAVEDGDYTISPSSPATIEFDDSNTSIDDLSLEAAALGEGESGVTLTTETRTGQVSLASATALADSVSREIAVGRGGEDVGVSRSFQVAPSITLTTPGIARLSSVSFDSTQVGSSSTASLLIHNTSGVDFDVSNFTVTGENAGELTVSPIIQDNPVEPLELIDGTDPFGIGLPLNDFGFVQVQFAPTSAGEKSATLQFDVSNSSDDITAEYEISGVATSSGS